MRHSPPNRDRGWLERLFDQHGLRVRAFAVRRVGADAGDDIVSEVFISAWRRRVDVPDDALGWLLQTARHAVLHHFRSSSRQATLRETVRWNSHATESPSAEDETRLLVDSILDALPPTDAEVLRLTVWDQLTPSEIAVVLGITPGAARTRLMRARQSAQEFYGASLHPEPPSVRSAEPCSPQH